MRIALAQFAASTEPADNLARVRWLAADAAAQDAELVVFPEAAMCSFARARADAAEPFDGPWATGVRQTAADLGVTIVAGMFTTTGDDRVRNTLLVTGAAEARYDKVHLFDALGYAESAQIEPGTEAGAFTLGTHIIGLATCYDIRFPGLFTHLARLGADLVVVPTSWAPGPGKLHQWRTLATARAMDSTAFIVGVDQSLSPSSEGSRRPTGVGHSIVVDPTGEVLLELGDADELALVDLDLDLVADVRERLPVLRHARRLG
ncbi:MAG: carbon-nitrogen hydrolase family protein [Propionicimonas sp.]|uniref:carbon-nitrogen hydrolase family protein n=1 Tax=Propionicimonas sp. TaxID=1955623 RepID=UPI003D1236DF